MSGSVTWLCCPAGVADETVRLSVVAVPRLSPDQDGAALADFGPLADWPAAVAATELVLSFSGTEVPATRVGEPADSALWRAVFARSTVRRFGSERDPLAVSVVEVAAGAAADAIRAAYATAALEDPTAVDTRTVLSDLFDVGPVEEFMAEQRQLLEETVAAQAGQGTARVPTPGRRATSAVAGVIAAPRLQAGGAPPAQEPLDVHRVLTLLGDHSWLRRRLGLVIDLEVPLAAVAGLGAKAVRLADASALPPGTDHQLPWTGIDEAFAVPSRAGAVPGVWPLDGGDYRLESMDVDAATTAGVASLSTASAGPGLPALRDDGIALVRTARADVLAGRLAARRDSRVGGGGTADSPLLEEDLTRGLRCDVLDETTGRYQSLHERRIDYTIDGYGDPAGGGGIEEEGVFHEVMTGDVASVVDERVLTWRGWSLSAPPAHAAPQRDGGRAAAWLDALHTHLVVRPVPNTLPRLRYGRTYRFRVRTVDAAGRSLPVDAAPDVTTGQFTFRRYQPVPPPVVAPIDPAQPHPPGATLTRLVARDPLVLAFAGGAGGPETSSERWLLPPPSSFDLAERHGMLDAGLGNANPSGQAATRTMLGRFNGRVDGPVDGVVPWLPDPQAVGVAFTGLPYAAADEVVTVPFEGASWDELAPVRLRVASVQELVWAGVDLQQPLDPHPKYDPASRTLTVYLPQASTTKVRVSSVLRDADLMALLHDIDAVGPAGADVRRAAAATRMRDAQHPMITPSIELVLVCAALPGEPEFEGPPRLGREAGETTLALQTSLTWHPVVTDELILRAAWDEERDRGPDGYPQTARRTVEVCRWRPGSALSQDPGRQTIAVDTDALGLPRLQLGTTGHRDVSLSLAATSGFADCFLPGDAPAREGTAVEVQVPNTAPPPPPLVRFVVPTQIVQPPLVERSEDAVLLEVQAPDNLPGGAGWVRTTVARSSGGIRVYLDRPWFSSGSGELLGVVLASPNLAVPPVAGAPDNTWALDESNPVTSWVSLAGQDPIAVSHRLGPLETGNFSDVAYTGTLAALPQARAAGVELPVTVLGFTPEFERSSGLWFADIAVDARSTYRPFFRLAVVRFQPASVSEELMVSPVTLLDPVQTLPSRRLTCVRHESDPEARVTMWGPTYQVYDEDLRARVSCAAFLSNQQDDDHWVAAAVPVDLDWLPENAAWSSIIPLPAAGPGQRLRLLVTEFDRVPAQAARAERVVFVGTIDL